MVATQPPNYEYTPNDFMILSLVTVIVCGIFSPLTLLLSLPALFFSQQVSVHDIVEGEYSNYDYDCSTSYMRM